jgi:8-amino-7-oxononanoate synthase
MANSFYQFATELQQLKQQNLYRTRQMHVGPQAVLVTLAGRQVVNFCSNDYLGLANHPAVTKAFREASDLYGVGSGSAHLICGHTREHHALEEELAAFTGRERVLLFSTGYMANLGVLAALVGHGDKVFSDRLNHASLLDAAVLSRARLVRFKHADMADLDALLAANQARAMLVSDGVFSMDGDLAPLATLVDMAERYQVGLFIDDAHGIGVLGAQGGGIVQQLGLTQQQVPILMGTLGKAIGTFGAFVAGSADLIEYLLQKSRTYVYTTALPAALAVASRVSLSLLQTESWRREKLQVLISQFRAGAEQLGLPLLASPTPIQPLLIGDSLRALEISQQLLARGFWVSAIRPPTVPVGTARLRITFSAQHSEVQVDALLDALAGVWVG